MTSVNSQSVTFLKGAMTPRPHLPSEWNQQLATFDITTVEEPVKFQIITREGQDIVIGRVKVPTNVKHAFILRRFDTGAISLSTMFRASYPTASHEAEKAEAQWVKTNFDTTGANGGGRLRLAGTWVSPSLALHIAETYKITHIVAPLAQASPEAAQNYRKSVKSQTPNPASEASLGRGPSQATTVTSPAAASPRATAAARAVSPVRNQPPTKRRRESPSPATTPPQVVTRSRATPGKQTAPSSSPSKSASKRKPVRVDHEEEPEVLGPNPEDDIAEQKALIARLKSEAEAAAAASAAAARTASELEHVAPVEIPTTPASKKRSLEDQETPPVRFDLERIKEVEEQAATGLVVDRPIVPLKRRVNLNPNQKAFAWGSLAFAIGIAATTYLPTFWL